MIIKNREMISSATREDGVVMREFFGKAEGEKVTMGHAVFPPGVQVPWAAHTGDEYSYVLSGSVKSECGGKIWEIRAGMAGFIPGGQEHRSFNDSDETCSLIWMLVEK